MSDLEAGDRCEHLVRLVHADRRRHGFAHEWKRPAQTRRNLVLLLDWASEDLPRLFGASSAGEAGMQIPARPGTGERA